MQGVHCKDGNFCNAIWVSSQILELSLLFLYLCFSEQHCFSWRTEVVPLYCLLVVSNLCDIMSSSSQFKIYNILPIRSSLVWASRNITCGYCNIERGLLAVSSGENRILSHAWFCKYIGVMKRDEVYTMYVIYVNWPFLRFYFSVLCQLCAISKFCTLHQYKVLYIQTITSF